LGGWGSGRSTSRYRSTDNTNSIDIRYLKKQGCLVKGYQGSLNWSVRGKPCGSVGYRVLDDALLLTYNQKRGNEWLPVQQRVSFARTGCHYGGERLWLVCPECVKRVVCLYGVGTYFLCRHCCKLPYASQGEDKADRLRRKARKVRAELGASNNLCEPLPYRKPKHMRWAKYYQLREAEQEANRASLLMMPASLKKQLGIS